tara:strand:+ start:333 stop:455 length:123 start_codon:yes stop_codon:yes gene_type:complete
MSSWHITPTEKGNKIKGNGLFSIAKYEMSFYLFLPIFACF